MSPALRPAALHRSALALAGLLGLLACQQAFVLVHGARGLKAQALAKGRRETIRMAATLNTLVQSLEPEVRQLAADLSADQVAQAGLEGRLRQGLERTPAGFRLGVTFAPKARGAAEQLAAPFLVRENGQLRGYQMEDQVHYDLQNWYQAEMITEGWQEPHLSKSTNQLTAGFSQLVRRPGSPQGAPLASVRMDLALAALRPLLSSEILGKAGYGCLFSSQGTLLGHPRFAWVTEGKTLFQLAQETGDASLWRCGELVLKGERGEVESTSYLGDQPIWIFSEPIPSAHWTLQVAVFQEEMSQSPVLTRRSLIRFASALMGMLACLGFAFMGVASGNVTALWRWQGLVSGLLALGVCLLWGLTLTYPDPPTDAAAPILSPEHLEKYFAARNPNEGSAANQASVRVPTGLFLKTLRFDAANDVVATGMLWQRLPQGFPKGLSQGFQFANAESQEITEAFRRKDGQGELVEYNFKATLRQNFDRTVKYPFDQVVVRLPLWPREFDARVSLVPDLEAYHVLNPASLPGLDPDLVLPGWTKEKSYFGFLDPRYATTFGAADHSGSEHPPELSFQLVLSRKFLDPFISAMLPVIVVGCLLFSLLLVGTKDLQKVRATGFKAIDILAATATLLFPVIYAQISLRSRLTSSTLLYLEYFYFVMYAAILLVAANALVFTLGHGGLVHRDDNALPKLVYWPLLLSSFFLISLLFLY